MKQWQRWAIGIWAGLMAAGCLLTFLLGQEPTEPDPAFSDCRSLCEVDATPSPTSGSGCTPNGTTICISATAYATSRP
ncbi:hypothetical protein ACFY00_38125 [Kitasatospora sp. NPDC001540]|uniref:hypothetical protein n=1 Tax=Kitasatospora sp. NPDC001540 TaxID=3364014 RepID=UPI0036C883D6